MKFENKAKLDNMDIKIQSLYFTAEQNMILKNMFSKHNLMVSKKNFIFNKPEYEGLVYNLSLNLNLFENVLDLKSNYQDISIILINKDNPSGLNKFKKILNEEENFAKKVILFGTSEKEDWQYSSYIQIPFEESNLLNTIYNAYLLYYKINFKGYENNLLFYESDTKFINIFKKNEFYQNQTVLEKSNTKTSMDVDNTINKSKNHLNPHIENFLLEKDNKEILIPKQNTTNIDVAPPISIPITHITPVANVDSNVEKIDNKDLKNSVNIELNLSQFKTSLDDLNITHLPQEEFKIDLSQLDNIISKQSQLEDRTIDSTNITESINNKLNEKTEVDNTISSENQNLNHETKSTSLLDFDFDKLHEMSENLNAFNLNTLNNPQTKEEDKAGMEMSSLEMDFNLEQLNKINEGLNFNVEEVENDNVAHDVIDEFGHFNEKEYENSINNFSTPNTLSTPLHETANQESNTDNNIQEIDQSETHGLIFDIPILDNLNEEKEDDIHQSKNSDNINVNTNSTNINKNISSNDSNKTVNTNKVENISTLKIKPLELTDKLQNQLNLLDDGLEKAYYDKDDIRDDKELNHQAIEQIHDKVKEGDEDYEQFLQDNPELLKEDDNVVDININSQDAKLEEFNDLMVERKKLSDIQQNQVGKLTQREIDLLDEELKSYNINKLTILNQIAQVRQLQFQLIKNHPTETCAEIIFDDPYEEEKHIFFINFETFELYTNFELKLTNSYTQSLHNYGETSLCHQYLTDGLKVNTLKNKIYYLNNLAVSHQTFDQVAWSEASENFSHQGFYRNNLLTFIMALTYELDPNPRLSQEIDIYQRYNLNLTPLLKNLYAKDITMLKWAIGMYQKSFMLSALQSIDDLEMSLNEKEFIQFINTAYLLGFLEESKSKNKENKGIFNKIKKIF